MNGKLKGSRIFSIDQLAFLIPLCSNVGSEVFGIGLFLVLDFSLSDGLSVVGIPILGPQTYLLPKAILPSHGYLLVFIKMVEVAFSQSILNGGKFFNGSVSRVEISDALLPGPTFIIMCFVLKDIFSTKGKPGLVFAAVIKHASFH